MGIELYLNKRGKGWGCRWHLCLLFHFVTNRVLVTGTDVISELREAGNMCLLVASYVRFTPRKRSFSVLYLSFHLPQFIILPFTLCIFRNVVK